MTIQKIQLGELMAGRNSTIDPAKFPTEEFTLYSIPAFESGIPESAIGSNIGSSKQIVEPNDVLLSKIVPHIRRSWIVQESLSSRTIASNEWIVFRSHKFHPPYLRHLLVSNGFHAKYMNTVAGVGGSLLRARPSFVSKIEVSLPPLEEQEHIAKALDCIEALRAKRRRAIELLDELTQSVFLDMFGDITKKSQWGFGHVSDLVARFESGKSLASASDETKSKYRILKISSVTSGTFKPQESKGAPPDHTPPDSHFAREGDLLFSRANTSELIGATALVSSPHSNLLLPDKLWRFVWHEEPKADPFYINHMFSQPAFRDAIRANSTGSSGSMKNISQKKVLSIPCALPPVSTQKEFAEKARRIQALKQEHLAHLERLDELFASVQQRAFDGTLWDDRDITV